MEIFGINLSKKKAKTEAVASVVSPYYDDGASLVAAANHYGVALDLDGSITSENDLIVRYREASTYPDCDSAIEDIVNDAVIFNDGGKSVEINLDNTKLSESIKTKISDEFESVLRLLKFDVRGHDIFRSWYIDGRLFYNMILSEDVKKKGIAELRYINPQKIRKIKTIKKSRSPQGVELSAVGEEYYLYNDNGLTTNSTQGVKLTIDSVAYCTSGIIDRNTGFVLSYIQKAIKPTNQLKMMEDSVVIYRISRAPERRIFYIDVGNLPKVKAEQYVQDMMNKFRNKLVYDSTTGAVRNDKKTLSMNEDFWMPRRGDSGKSTEIETLPGASNLDQIADLEYFQNKLFQSLNVPISRLKPDAGFSLGRSSEITRDEIKFSKFINRLRTKFSEIFSEILKIQLVSKGIIREDEWAELVELIRYKFYEDNHFSELKDAEILQNRLANLQLIDLYVGKYYSIEWIKKNVLMQSDEEIKEISKQMAAEPVVDTNPNESPDQ